MLLVIAALAIAGEGAFVSLMKFKYPGAGLTGVYSLILFVGMCGLIPSWPAPSRMSAHSLSRGQRVLISAEVTVVVASAIFLFREFSSAASTGPTSVAAIAVYCASLGIFAVSRSFRWL